MSVVVSCQDVGPCRKELKIEVPAPAVEAETLRVVQEYARTARLPGFRKGKVPQSLVKKRFRADIDQDVLERLVPRYWRQAEAEASIESLLAPSIGEVDHKEGEDLTFTATVEVRPEIELSPDRNFDLPNPSVDVSEEELRETIEGLRSDVAPWVKVERAASRGDRVQIRLWSKEEEEGRDRNDPDQLSAQGQDGEVRAEEGTGSAVESQGLGQEVAVEVGSEQVWEELSLTVTGLEAGQQAEFSRQEQPPEGDGPQEPVVKSFGLEVLEVQEKELAPLDDDFSKQFGDLENLKALEDAVSKRMTLEKTSARREERRRRLLDQLIERHPLDLPEGVVEHETRGMLREYADGLSARGVDVERGEVDWEALGEQVRPQASQRVHARLLLDAIGADEGIQVGEEELENALAVLARSQGQSTVAVRQALDRDGRLNAMRMQMRREKTLRHLLGEDQETDSRSAAADEEE